MVSYNIFYRFNKTRFTILDPNDFISNSLMKFSIVTPSYNQDEFIERTIESVISQKWDFEIEYIVMDGWSKDETDGM